MVLFNFIRINPQVEYCKFGKHKNYCSYKKGEYFFVDMMELEDIKDLKSFAVMRKGANPFIHNIS